MCKTRHGNAESQQRLKRMSKQKKRTAAERKNAKKETPTHNENNNRTPAKATNKGGGMPSAHRRGGAEHEPEATCNEDRERAHRTGDAEHEPEATCSRDLERACLCEGTDNDLTPLSINPSMTPKKREVRCQAPLPPTPVFFTCPGLPARAPTSGHGDDKPRPNRHHLTHCPHLQPPDNSKSSRSSQLCITVEFQRSVRKNAPITSVADSIAQTLSNHHEPDT